MAKPQHFSQSVSLVLQPAREGVGLELDVRVAVEAGEGTWRVCICIAGAQKCEERESMDVTPLDVRYACVVCAGVHTHMHAYVDTYSFS